jgi:hypothetical protein
VGRDQHGCAAIMCDRVQQRNDLLGARTVQVSGRLVGENQARLACECTRDRDPLALTAGQLARRAPKAVPEADTLQPRSCTGLCLAHAHTAQQKLDRSILDSRNAWHQMVVLINKTDVPE